MGLSMLYVGLFVRIAPPQKGEPVIPAGYFALVCIYLFASFFQWGWGPVSLCSSFLKDLNQTDMSSRFAGFTFPRSRLHVSVA